MRRFPQPIKRFAAVLLISISYWGLTPRIAIAQRLTAAEVTEQMQHLPGWSTDGQSLCRTYQFADFVEAIQFVNQLVEPAESAAHHPDIAISYNRVVLKLTTHDAGGLTQADFDLAQTISQLGHRQRGGECRLTAQLLPRLNEGR